MELDDLKKTWNRLDEQLQKEDIVNEENLSELITKYKSGVKQGIDRIGTSQKISVYIGAIAVVVLFFVASKLLPINLSEAVQAKINLLIGFIGISLIIGLFWDLKTYNYLRKTHIDEMPILTVVERINKFRAWTRYEVIGISTWLILFGVLYYWVMNIYKLPLLPQLTVIAVLLVAYVSIVYLLYKKLIYSNLDDVRKNLEDLKEVTEQ